MMVAAGRLEAAMAGAEAVAGASGLLAAFNEGGALSPLEVHAAMVISRLWDESDQAVMLAAALAVRGTRFGHVCIRLDAQREAMVIEGQPPEVVEALPWPDPEEWVTAVSRSAMVGDGPGEEPLVLEGDRLYLERYYRHEERVVNLIGMRTAVPRAELTPESRTVLDELLPPGSDNRPNLQHAAAVNALTGKLTVVAGGPGTGKTYTVARMLEALARTAPSFPRVALCAPTGKAAARLGEVIDELAARAERPIVRERLETLQTSTIHRLLGWTWGRGRFAHHDRNRLPHDLVVVDEMSMVSLPLAAKLIAAVRADATVVLVGDPYQLESIEAGTVLADIVGPATRPPDPEHRSPAPGAPAISDSVVVLERVHRFEEKGPIADFADAVRDGDPDRAMEMLDRGVDGLHWVQDRAEAGFRRLRERVAEHRARLVEAASLAGGEEEALARLGEMAVLCANRDGPGSVDQWRRDIEDALDERFPGLRYRGEWYPGRPLMITRNDYNLGLYNGDIGVVVRAGQDTSVMFDRGGIRSFPPGYLGEHSTVHALTIHKSQGSQFDEVVVSLPRESSRLLTRELLYTAVTRASKKVTVVGPESAIRLGIERSVQRASGLRSRLWDKSWFTTG